MLDRIGVDAVCVEVDYPHSDSSWPYSPERLAEQMAHLSAEDVAKITHLNAMQHFGFDPFATRDPSTCTAAALRANATGVDVGPRPAPEGFVRPSRPLTMTDMLNAASHPMLDQQAADEGLGGEPEEEGADA
jgi:hypothetical protein